MTTPIMKEHELSWFGRGTAVLVLVYLGFSTLDHIAHGDPVHPFAFGTTLIGFVLFVIAKVSVIVRKRWISFGSGLMTSGMADTYRVGYWLMVVGVLATFTA